MKTPTIHDLAADIQNRIPGMKLDCSTNNRVMLEAMLKPVYDELIAVKAAEASLRNAVFDLCGHLPGVSDEEMLSDLKHAHEGLMARCRELNSQLDSQ